MKLKAEVGRAKEAAEALKMESYKIEVQETEVCLADELVEVCRDYCNEVWMKALNFARVLTTSKWRQVGNVYYPPNIRKVLAGLSPPIALATVSLSSPLSFKHLFLLLRFPQGLAKLVTKDKGKGKEGKPLSEAKDLETTPKLKDALSKAKDVVVKAKEVEAKSKDADPKVKDASASRPGNKEDLTSKCKA